MNSPLEEYGTSVHHVARHVRQCLRAQPGLQTVLAAALQLLFDCLKVVLPSLLRIWSDCLVAAKKCAEPVRQHGGPRYEEYAGLC